LFTRLPGQLNQRRPPITLAMPPEPVSGPVAPRSTGNQALARLPVVAHGAVISRLPLGELVGPRADSPARRSCPATQLRLRGCRGHSLRPVVADCASRRATAPSPTAAARACPEPGVVRIGGASASEPKGAALSSLLVGG
jgi:hypothetical protein